MSSVNRQATSLSLDPALLSEAQSLDVELSHAAETGISKALQVERERLWLADNAGAIEDYNDYIEKNGPPLDEYRTF